MHPGGEGGGGGEPRGAGGCGGGDSDGIPVAARLQYLQETPSNWEEGVASAQAEGLFT